MFVNRGMIEAANSEGEVVGVMAHELSHVLLRHGTAQASKAGKYQMGQVAGAVLGAIIGGRVGSVVAQGTQFGLGTAFLRFSREYRTPGGRSRRATDGASGLRPERHGEHVPHDRKAGRLDGPEWLSDHPNPGNRSEDIEKEAQSLKVATPVADRSGFDPVKSHLKSLPKAPSSEEAAKATSRRTTDQEGSRPNGTLGPVQPPSSRYREYSEGNLFRVSVPNNWRELPGSAAVTFAPTGAFGQAGNQNVFTHGVEVGVNRNERHDLPEATRDFIQILAQSNGRLSQRSDSLNAIIDGQAGPANQAREHFGRDRQGGGHPALHDDASRRHTLLCHRGRSRSGVPGLRGNIPASREVHQAQRLRQSGPIGSQDVPPGCRSSTQAEETVR